MSESRNILVMLNTTMRPYFRQIFGGVADYTNQHQHPAWHLSLPNYFSFLQLFPAHATDRYDGVITGMSEPAFIRKWVNAGKVPSLIGFKQSCPADLVYLDLDGIANLGYRQLRSGGAEQFAYFGLDYPRDPWSQDMIRAFEETVDGGIVFRRKGGEWTFETELEELRSWLKDLPPRTGILAGNDDYAGRIYEAAGMENLLPGRDFTVVGLGNDPIYCESLRPSLTSIDLPLRKMGFLAAERLAERLQDPSMPPRNTEMGKPNLVRRSSHFFHEVEDTLVDRALAILRADLAHIRSATDLASEIGTSRHTLQRRLKAVLGKSSATIIRETRVNEARRLLTTTGMPLAEVAHQTGFSDQAHLTRIMRQSLGKTPRQVSMEANGLD